MEEIDQITNFRPDLKLTDIAEITFHYHKLVIDACDGKTIIAEAKDIFINIDSYFKSPEMNESGLATKKTFLDAYTVTKKASCLQMFKCLHPNLDKSLVTQSQIISFCKDNTWIQAGVDNLFLIKEDGDYFVVRLFKGYLHPDYLRISIDLLDDDENGEIYLVDECDVVFAPQLAPSGHLKSRPALLEKYHNLN